MATTKQALANRENAKHSTGPKTKQGKASSAQNSLRHGLASRQIIICGESCEEYEKLHAGLVADHQPADNTESLLVAQMAEARWLMERALRFQQNAFDNADGIPKDLAILLRYYTTYERSFHKALATLTKLQSDKKKAEIGFVSQQEKNRIRLVKEARRINEERIHRYMNGPLPNQPGWTGALPQFVTAADLEDSAQKSA